MRTRIITSRCRRGWPLLPLAALLLAGACDRPQPTAPEAVAPLVPAEQAVVAQLAFEVDPVSGAVTMLEASGSASGPERSLSQVIVTPDHVLSSVSCSGCRDGTLSTKRIMVRFTVKDFVLEGVDFRRIGEGDHHAAMSCHNCRVRMAQLLDGEGVQPPWMLERGNVIFAWLWIDPIELRPFTVRFDLMAESIRPGPCRAEYFPGTGNYYEFIPASGIRWSTAREVAETRSCNGLGGHLATITSPEENNFVRALVTTDRAWLGGSDAAQEGIWRWISGPEAGTQFWQGGPDGQPVGGAYVNWAPGQPDNFTGVEHYLWMWGPTDPGGRRGFWNDASAEATGGGYVVEYSLGAALLEETITAGANHSCGLTAQGRAYCWGDNASGQLGDNSTTRRLVPTAVEGNHTFRSISAGYSHTVGVATSGRALAWGANGAGQLGDGTTTPRLLPTPVEGNHIFHAVSAGGLHTAAVTPSGQALAWGANGAGQLGDGSTESRQVPTPVVGGHVFRSISAGIGYTVGVTTSGQALAWGGNVHGELGVMPPGGRLVPTAVAGNYSFRSVSAGTSHTLGVTTHGDALAWGFNYHGQLGDGTDDSALVPIPVLGGHKFRSLSAGNIHSVGVTTTGQVLAWGAGGLVGDGSTTSRWTPTPVEGNRLFRSVSAAGFHTVGVTTSGQAYAWGRNDQGQLGNGTTSHQLVPTPVAGGLTFR
jgi:alpha-tubulin suppressor-like RCC1 family protein